MIRGKYNYLCSIRFTYIIIIIKLGRTKPIPGR